MYNLKEFIGTRYATINYVDKIRFVLATNDEIDIANIRMVPSVASVIATAQLTQDVSVIDSVNSERNYILHQNANRREVECERKPLPLLEGVDYIKYLKELETDCLYTIDHIRITDKVHVPLITLALILRGDVLKIEIGDQISEILKIVSSYLYKEQSREVVKTSDRFYVQYKTSTFLVEPTTKDFNTEFSIYGLGKDKWQGFVTKYYMVPEYFGEVDIRKTEHLHLWSKVIAFCGKAVEEGVQHKRRTLKEVLGGALS